MSLITNGFGNVTNSAIYKFNINIKKHIFKTDIKKYKFKIDKKVILFKIRKVKV